MIWVLALNTRSELTFSFSVPVVEDRNLIILTLFATLSKRALMNANAPSVLRAPCSSLRTASKRSIFKVDHDFIVETQWRHTDSINVWILECCWTEAGHFTVWGIFRENKLIWTRLFTNVVHVWFRTVVTDASSKIGTVVSVFMAAELTNIQVEGDEINVTI